LAKEYYNLGLVYASTSAMSVEDQSVPRRRRGGMLRNAAFLLVSDLTVRGSALVMAVAIARAVGPGEYGRFTYALAFAAAFGACADFGIGRYLTRSIAGIPRRAPELLPAALAAKTLVLVPCLAVAVPLVVRAAADWRLLLLLLLVTTGQTYASVPRGAWYGMERMELDAATRLCERCIALAGTLLALAAGWGLIGVGIAWLAATVADLLVVGWLVLRERAAVRWLGARANVASLLRSAWPLGLSGLVLTLSSGVPLFLLKNWVGVQATGQYSAAVTPVLALIPLPVTVAAAGLPVLSRLYRVDRSEVSAAFDLQLRLFALVGLAAAAGLAVTSPTLLRTVYGPAFAPSGDVPRILALGLIAIFPTQVCVNVLVAAGRQSLLLRVDVVGLIWQLGFDWVAVRWWGVRGAAVGTTAGELLLCFCFLVAASRAVGRPRLQSLLPALPAVGGMTIVALVLLPLAGLWATIPVGIVVYGALLALFRPISGDDLIRARALFAGDREG